MRIKSDKKKTRGWDRKKKSILEIITYKTNSKENRDQI
jgi:hypothetical protein